MQSQKNTRARVRQTFRAALVEAVNKEPGCASPVLSPPCAAPACDGVTPRLVDEENPNTAFPTYGEVSGGFEVYITEGYSHVDIVSAQDDDSNNVIAPLLAFVVRHLQ